MRIIGLFAAAFLAASSPRAESDIRVVQAVAFDAYVRPMVGDYAQHARAIRQLYDDVDDACTSHGLIFGEYPQDPSIVGMENVQWRLGVTIPPSAQCTLPRSTDVSRATIPPSLAATIMSTLGRSFQDGRRLLRWVPESGYAQSGPTRMEYLARAEHPDTPVRIVVPVTRRTWHGPAIVPERDRGN